MFEGFKNKRIDVDGVTLNVRVGGSGPALVMLHGYPQTHIMWRLVAPELAKTHTVVCPDLRGYGDSDSPPSDAEHLNFSKRAMAADVAGLMTKLGHETFAVITHDRGARVGYRLCLDFPERATHFMSLDVVPTHEMWSRLGKSSALGGFHWQFLAQPAPKPETMIAGNPDYWMEWLMYSWASSDFTFDAEAMDAYKAAFRKPDVIRGTCEDYRAGATVDDAHDTADKVAGRKLQCPMVCLWGGSRSLGGPKTSSPLDVWRDWAEGPVAGEAVPESGHFIAEEAPDVVIRWVKKLLSETT
jgi:haloacetate dehalogenase